MTYTQESDYEYVTYRRFTTPVVVQRPRREAHFTFQAEDFQWTAADIEFYFKLWFYHWILYGTSDILDKPLPASFVHWVRRKCSNYAENQRHPTNSPAGAE